jgi:hypothetical protein
MVFDQDAQAEAIAAQWGVDVALLQQASWTVATIDGNDGELYGYVVRFDDDDTPPEILQQLGLRFGQLERELSINAFDEPDQGSFGAGRFGVGQYGGESYSLEEPFPDLNDVDFNDPGEDEDYNEFGEPSETGDIASAEPLPSGEAYLTDEHGRHLVDEHGRRLIVDVPATNAAGSNFSNFTFAESTFGPSSNSPRDYQGELLSRIASLEASLHAYQEQLPARNHNHPPELVESDPLTHTSIKWAVPLVGARWALGGSEKVYSDLMALAGVASAWAQVLFSAS